jgi:hypothetical protein
MEQDKPSELAPGTTTRLLILYANVFAQLLQARTRILILRTKIDRNAGEVVQLRDDLDLVDSLQRARHQIEQLLWPRYDSAKSVLDQLAEIESELNDVPR